MKNVSIDSDDAEPRRIFHKKHDRLVCDRCVIYHWCVIGGFCFGLPTICTHRGPTDFPAMKMANNCNQNSIKNTIKITETKENKSSLNNENPQSTDLICLAQLVQGRQLPPVPPPGPPLRSCYSRNTVTHWGQEDSNKTQSYCRVKIVCFSVFRNLNKHQKQTSPDNEDSLIFSKLTR